MISSYSIQESIYYGCYLYNTKRVYSMNGSYTAVQYIDMNNSYITLRECIVWIVTIQYNRVYSMNSSYKTQESI